MKATTKERGKETVKETTAKATTMERGRETVKETTAKAGRLICAWPGSRARPKRT
jgi:hypothetical protein